VIEFIKKFYSMKIQENSSKISENNIEIKTLCSSLIIIQHICDILSENSTYFSEKFNSLTNLIKKYIWGVYLHKIVVDMHIKIIKL